MTDSIKMTQRPQRLCDEDCNHCPIIIHKNSRQLSLILNQLYEKFGTEAYKIIQYGCPNMTVCYDCRIDDFTHVEDCKIMDKIHK